MAEPRAFVIDCEAHAVADPIPVQVAWVPVYLRGNIDVPLATTGGIRAQHFNPGVPITLGARAIHHIRDEDVASEDPWEGLSSIPELAALGDDAIWIGHNVDFDWEALGKPAGRRICTLALCRHLWPEAETHSLVAMGYHVCGRQDLRNAHDAIEDVGVTLDLLDVILRKSGVRTWDGLHALSEKARIPTHMPFGKHKGERIEDVPADYVRWLLGQSDVDPYLRRALTEVRRG